MDSRSFDPVFSVKMPYVPLLHIHWDLYRMPRICGDSKTIFRVMTNADRKDLDLPPLAKTSTPGSSRYKAQTQRVSRDHIRAPAMAADKIAVARPMIAHFRERMA